MGGRHPLGQALLTVAATLAVFAVIAGRLASDPASRKDFLVGARVGVIELLALAGIAVGCVQLVPLPHRYLNSLSQHYDTLLPLFSGRPSPAAMGIWDQVSLMPGETLSGLGIFLRRP